MGRINLRFDFEGEPADVAEAVQRIFGGPSRRPEVDPRISGGETRSWDPVDARRFLGEIRSEAKSIMAELAKKPQGYPFDLLRTVLGMKAPQIAGRLSSIGHRLRRWPGYPHPIVADTTVKEYRLDETFAAVLREKGGE